MTPRGRRWAGRLGEAVSAAFAFAVFVAVVPGIPTGPGSAGSSPAPLPPGPPVAAASSGSSGAGSSGSSGAVGSSGATGSSAGSAAPDLSRSSGSATTGTGPRDVYVVGDSLTVGTEPWLRPDVSARDWTFEGVDARVGRGVPEGLSVLRSHVSSLPAGTVVLALGTNSLGATAAEVAGWLRTARAMVGSRRLVWVNLCLDGQPGTWLGSYRQINRWLALYAPYFDVQVADWCSFATRYGIHPGSDGIHYSPAGYRERAAFYAAAIAGWAGAFDRS